MDALKESLLLRKEEGVRCKRYKDSKGLDTIGVGWNIGANPLPEDIAQYERDNGCITSEMVDRLLDIQIDMKLKDCHKIYPAFDTFSENRQEALVDLMFNMGMGTILKFKNMNKAINLGQWQEAANQLKFSDGKSRLSKWYQDVHETRGEELYLMILNG